jgi:hypothetical protein
MAWCLTGLFSFAGPRSPVEGVLGRRGSPGNEPFLRSRFTGDSSGSTRGGYGNPLQSIGVQPSSSDRSLRATAEMEGGDGTTGAVVDQTSTPRMAKSCLRLQSPRQGRRRLVPARPHGEGGDHENEVGCGGKVQPTAVDEFRGTYRGVGIGNTTAEVERVFGHKSLSRSRRERMTSSTSAAPPSSPVAAAPTCATTTSPSSCATAMSTVPSSPRAERARREEWRSATTPRKHGRVTPG